MKKNNFLKGFVFLLLIIASSSIAIAVQDGTTELIFLSNQPGCNSEHNSSFNAGSTIYAKIKFTNTGTEDLVNARTFIIDSYSGNYGYYTTGNLFFNVKKNESIIICYPSPTYSSYQPGKWLGRIYFRNYNSMDLAPVKTYNFDITSTTTDYQAVSMTTNLTSYTIVLAGEQKIFYIDVKNKNPTDNFIGTLTLSNLKHVDTGSTTKAINIPGGQTERFLVTNVPMTTLGPQYTGIYIDASTGQDNIRSWPRLVVEGDYYGFIVRQLYASQSAYAPGEKGRVSIYLQNAGNAQWDAQSTYRVVIKGKPGTSGAYQTVYDGTLNFPDSPTHNVNEYKWYTTNEFTNPLSPLMANFIIYFYAYDPLGNPMRVMWGGATTSYALNDYPDVSSQCTSTTFQAPTGIQQKLICSANGNMILFLQEPPQGDIVSINAISGSLSTWWQGEKDGIPGYFIRGSTDAVYEITFQITKILEMDAFNFTPILFAISILIFSVFFYFRRK